MTLTVYGQAQSRAVRALWMVEELGVPYAHVPTRFADEAKGAEFRAVNPNGRVPTIDDDGFVVFESMAIKWMRSDGKLTRLMRAHMFRQGGELPEMVPMPVRCERQHKFPLAISKRCNQLCERWDRRIDDDRLAAIGIAEQRHIGAQRSNGNDERFSAHAITIAFVPRDGRLRG